MNMLFNCNQIKTLNGSNFKKWTQDLELCLGYSDYEHMLNEDPPVELTPTSTRDAKDKYEKWYKHNRMVLVIMKRSISEAVKGGIPDAKLAREYFKNLEEKYQISDKAETGALMSALTGMKFDGVGSIRDYILKGIEIAAKLRALGVAIDDVFLVHLILNSLPSQYSQLECNYNTEGKMECERADFNVFNKIEFVCYNSKQSALDSCFESCFKDHIYTSFKAHFHVQEKLL